MPIPRPMRARLVPQWFDDAAPPVAAACRAALRLLEARGLEVVEVGVPELALLRAAHSCTITSEMRNNMTGEGRAFLSLLFCQYMPAFRLACCKEKECLCLLLGLGSPHRLHRLLPSPPQPPCRTAPPGGA